MFLNVPGDVSIPGLRKQCLVSRLSERDLCWRAGPEREHWHQQVIFCPMHGRINSWQCQNFTCILKFCKKLERFIDSAIQHWLLGLQTAGGICHASPIPTIHPRCCLQLTHFCWSGGCELVGITRTQKPGQSVRYHVSGQTLRPPLLWHERELRADRNRHLTRGYILASRGQRDYWKMWIGGIDKSSKCPKDRNEAT